MVAVDPLVAEVPPELVDALDPTDEESLEVELERDPELHLDAERVVEGRERPRVRAARHRLEDRTLGLDEAAFVQHLARSPEDRRARGEEAAGSLVRDQMEVATPLLQIRVPEAVPLLRQRTERLRQHRPAGDEDRELATTRRPDRAGGRDDVAEIHLVEERERLGLQLGLVADELEVAAAVTEREELQLPHVPLQDHATGDGDRLLGSMVRGKARVPFAEVRGRDGLVHAERVLQGERERPVPEPLERCASGSEDLLLARGAARVRRFSHPRSSRGPVADLRGSGTARGDRSCGSAG